MLPTSLVLVDDRSLRCVARSVASGDTATIRLTGELTGETTQVLIQNVRRLLAQGCSHLRVDLGEVDFVDARGLAAAVVAAKMAHDVRAEFGLVRPSPLIARILDAGGLALLRRDIDD